jgi:hypothetical protein
MRREWRHKAAATKGTASPLKGELQETIDAVSWLLFGGYGFFARRRPCLRRLRFRSHDTGIFSADDQGHEERYVDARVGNGICDFVSEGRLVVVPERMQSIWETERTGKACVRASSALGSRGENILPPNLQDGCPFLGAHPEAQW